MNIFRNIFLSKEDREIKNMSDNEARVEIDRMLKRSGRAFIVSNGSSQKYWKLKEKLGEGI